MTVVHGAIEDQGLLQGGVRDGSPVLLVFWLKRKEYDRGDQVEGQGHVGYIELAGEVDVSRSPIRSRSRSRTRSRSRSRIRNT